MIEEPTYTLEGRPVVITGLLKVTVSDGKLSGPVDFADLRECRAHPETVLRQKLDEAQSKEEAPEEKPRPQQQTGRPATRDVVEIISEPEGSKFRIAVVVTSGKGFCFVRNDDGCVKRISPIEDARTITGVVVKRFKQIVVESSSDYKKWEGQVIRIGQRCGVFLKHSLDDGADWGKIKWYADEDPEWVELAAVNQHVGKAMEMYNKPKK